MCLHGVICVVAVCTNCDVCGRQAYLVCCVQSQVSLLARWQPPCTHQVPKVFQVVKAVLLSSVTTLTMHPAVFTHCCFSVTQLFPFSVTCLLHPAVLSPFVAVLLAT